VFKIEQTLSGQYEQNDCGGLPQCNMHLSVWSLQFCLRRSRLSG
jgi:hypothetical protein